MNKLSRYNYVDVLRVTSSIAVIAIHVIMYYIGAFKVHSTPWTVLMSSKAITQFAVPIFFMVSGATIFSSTREESYGSFIKRRLTKICIPFFVYSVLYYLFYVFVKKEFELGVMEFLKKFCRNNIQGHFWYLYALIPLYFLYPAIKKWVQTLSKKGLLSVIITLFMLDSFFPLLNKLFALFSSDFRFSVFSFGKLGVYLNYTLIGYFIHTYIPANKKNGFIAALLGSASLFSMIALTYRTSVNSFDQQWIDILLAFVVVQSASVMLLTKCIYEKKEFKPFAQKTLSTLGMLSFSAYLVHMLVLRTVQLNVTKIFIKTLPVTHAAGVIFAIFAASVVVCYLWAYIVSKIPVIKKIL